MTQEEKIKKAAIAFLQERAEMAREGFPPCYSEGGIQFHCKSCMTFFKQRKETHEIDSPTL